MSDTKSLGSALSGLLEQWRLEPPGRSALARLFDVASAARAHQLLRQWRASGLAEAVPWPVGQRAHVALAGFTTLNYLAPHIESAMLADGMLPTVTVGGYNQLFQDLADPAGGVLAPGVEMVWILCNLGDLLPADLAKHPARLATESGLAAVDDAIDALVAAVRGARARSRALFLVNELVPLRRSPLGIADGARFPSFESAYRRANERLLGGLSAIESAYVFPLGQQVARAGLDQATDPRLRLSADCLFTPDFSFRLAQALRPYVRALKGAARKVLVLDLDNTLWGGIVGEDGWDGVKIGDDPVGRAFTRFQASAIELYERGVILAVNSKNNLADVEELFRNRSEMLLALDHFASLQVNWSDKVTNCRAIAEDLNVGLDSLVFWDDSPAERELVRQSLEDVFVVDVPKDPSTWGDLLAELTLFDALHIAAEDRQRGRMYAEDRRRREAAVVTQDIGAFLASLDLKITVAQASDLNIPRIASLLVRTNQFNLTTRRHPETVLRDMAASEDWSALCYAAEDRFGSYGIVGVTIARRGPDAAEVDSLLLSCRALGKGIEDTMLAIVARQARRWGASAIRATYVPTKKNSPVKDFLPRSGFAAAGKRDDAIDYVLDLTRRDVSIPAHVTVDTEEPSLP